MRLTLLALSLFASTAALHAASVSSCAANQVSLYLDGEGGNFDGMSHSGGLLVVRNIGPTACSVPGFPVLTFRDASKATLPITREVPRGMHPGPVIVPAIIAPGAEVTATLRWVSGDVYDHGACAKPATVSLTLAGSEISTAALGQICGESATKITYQTTRLAPDPVYTPKP